MPPDRQPLIRSLFDEYIEMYASRDERLTTRFSENFSGYTGSGNSLVVDRSEWVNVTRQDFSQVTGRIRIEMLDVSMQDVSDDVVVVTAFFHIHMPAPTDDGLARETARLVLVFRLEGDDWKIVHNGISIPYNLVRDGKIQPPKDSRERNGQLQAGEVHPLKALRERNSQLEAMAAERNRALDARNHILEMLATGSPLSGILEAIVRTIEQSNTVTRCKILLLDDDTKNTGNIAAPSLPHFYTPATAGMGVGAGVVSVGTAVTSELAVISNTAIDLSRQPREEVGVNAAVGTCWSQPIRSASGKVLGTLAIYYDHPDTPDKYNLSIIEQFAHLVGIAIDRNVTTEKIKASDALYRLLTEDVFDVVWKTDPDLRVTYISPADERWRGYGADEVIGHHVFEMFTAEGIATVTEIMLQRREAEQNGDPAGSITLEIQHRCKDGSLIFGEVLFTPERDSAGVLTGYHGVTREITQRKQMQDRVHQLALYDTLTHLPNRRLLNERMSQTMAASKRSGSYGALIFLDLDNFQPLNDMHGHQIGDLLLVEAAVRLKDCVRETDTVSRFGGDEFVVMLSGLNSDEHAANTQAEVVAEGIRAALSKPFLLRIEPDGKSDATVEYHCTASIGVALFIDHEISHDEILKRADAAMYLAKVAGRNSIRFYAAAA